MKTLLLYAAAILGAVFIIVSILTPGLGDVTVSGISISVPVMFILIGSVLAVRRFRPKE